MNERKLFQKYNISINETSEFFQQNDMKKLNRVSSKKFKNFKNKKGITLIALVISIIVMLILAGVSLNATIGDNGIITQAQNATYMQSIVALEEYLNNYYVENYEKLANEKNKIDVIKNMKSDWFYNGSPIGYIVDSNGDMHYFINKDGLPEDLKSQIKGGDAGDKSYRAYASMKDVYGVTSDLKVYYCINNEKILGNVEFDKDNQERVIFEPGSDFAKLLTGTNDKSVTLDDIKGKKTLTISKESNITNLSELYKFISLTDLTLDGITLENLDGIENLGYLNTITLIDTTINEYSKLNKLNSQIIQISFINSTNEEIARFCRDTSNTGYANLKKFEIYSSDSEGDNSKIYRVNDISSLDLLDEQTKQAINILNLGSNKIENLDALSDFVNVEKLAIPTNKIKTLKGIEKMSKLKNLNAYNNQLGLNEIYDSSLPNLGKDEENDALVALKNKVGLTSLDLSYNINLKWISYIKDCSATFESLKLNNCDALIIKDLTEIRNIWYTAEMKSINSDKLIAFNSDDVISLAMKNLNDESDEIKSLYNNSVCEKLSLEGNRDLTDEEINKVLSTMTNLKYLSLKNVTNFTNLDFIKENSNLVEIDLRGTSCTKLTNLNNCKNLTNLAVDNKNTDFTDVQNVINEISKKERIRAYWANYINFYPTIESAKNLNNCTEIEILDIFEWPATKGEKTLDLSACIGLKNVKGQNTYVQIKYPNSIIDYTVSNNACPDLSSVTNITRFTDAAMQYSQEELNKLFEDLSKSKNLNSLELHAMKDGIIYSLNNIKKLKETTIKILTLQDWNDGRGQQAFNSLVEIGEIASLKELHVKGQKNLTSTKGIENLTNLTTLDLYGSKITNLTGIENLTNLTSVSLNNCDLYDTYLNQNNKETMKTLDVLANLNYKKNGNLKSLHLYGNNKITNWESVSKLSWENKNGF